MSVTEIPKNLPVTSYKAKYLMSPKVLTVYEGWSIQRLADFFMNHQISGAPVIASDHELVGVVSTSDIFYFENMDDAKKRKALQSCYRDACGAELNLVDLQEWSKNAQKNCTVHQIMIKDVISVDVDAPLSEIAQLMVDQDIHRVFVTEKGKIVGVISTSDILRVLSGPVPAVADRVATA